MKKSVFQKIVCLMLSVVMLFGAFVTSVFAFDEIVADENHGSAEGGYRPTLDEMKTYLDASSYAAYLEEYKDSQGNLPVPDLDKIKDAGYEDGVYRIDVVEQLHKDYTDYEASAEKTYGVVVKDSEICAGFEAWENFGAGMEEKSVYLSSESVVMWDLDVPADGMYYIRITYFSCNTDESSISSIERQLLINAALPFTEAGSLKLNKTWKYNYVAENVELPLLEGDKDGVSTSYARLEAGETDKVTGYTAEKDGYFKLVVTVSGGKKTATVYQIAQDINGNSMKPHMIQDPQWTTYYCQDTTGFYNEYFSFYFQQGQNSLTLKAQREPMIISSIELVPIGSDADIPTYDEYYAANGLASKDRLTSGSKGEGKVTIQAEFPDYMSDSSVSIGSDNSSSATYPSAPSAQLHNTIGKLSYSTVGQWAAYTLKVDKTGLYKLSMRYKQNALQGMYVCRALKLKGGIYGDEAVAPFKEAYNTQFDYSDDWQSNYLGAPNLNTGEWQDFEFYFEEGVEYTLYLECSLGSLKELIKGVEDAMEILNNSYLRILQLTGVTPDVNYDYRFHETLPMELIALAEQARVLDRTARAFEELCGTKGSHIATLDTVALLLHNMSDRWGEEIAANMANLKSYLGTLGTWINDSKRSVMVVDSITVHPVEDTEKQLPKAKAGFFGSMWFEIRSFFASFFTDYDAMGLTEKPKAGAESVEVWIATGRDQSNIWRSLIDSEQGFTNQTGKAVQLKLVTAGTLLPSILASKGPDVYIGLDAASIINYAIRDAIIGISGNYQGGSGMKADEVDELNEVFNSYYYTVNGEDYTEAELAANGLKKEDATFVSVPYEEITGRRYVPAAIDTITLLGVSYGIPSGMGFAMMFYRSDILAELGREIPKTWNELMGLLPDMQANNMSIGLTHSAALDFILYQRGGNMWLHTDNDQYAGARIGLNTDVAKAAFSWVTRLYTEFGFDVSFDGANRFRTGEMPIVIAEYTSTYNTLTVYATELNGVWGFCSLPGWERPHPKEEGMIWIDYSSICSISATILLHGYEDAISSWQFMQWQTHEDVQSEYGNQMVALIGPSAKYESANIYALDGMSWTAEEKKAIWDQMDHLYSVVNYPGSYIIGRYTNFAFLAAVNERQDPVEALMSYIDAINDEVYRKRAEYDLPLLETDELPENA